MKHILPFESLHTEPMENQYYTFGKEMKYSNLRKEQWDEDEIEELKQSIQSLPDKVRHRVFGRNESIDTYEVIDDYTICINIPKYKLIITKFEDEWFSVSPKPTYGTMVHLNTQYYIYQCDQINGVIKLLQEFTKK
jgi:hypothetical protein